MKVLANAGAGEGQWLHAEKQSGGKGRLGRVWESPKGNLYCSSLVEIKPADPPPSSLSFVSALAVRNTIASYLPEANIMLKWPNDILVTDKKICGILLERVDNMIVVGIGVNIAIAPILPDRKTTSLLAEGAESTLTASRFLEVLSENFAKTVCIWRQQGLSHILKKWQNRAHPIGATLTVSDEKGRKIAGEYAGLTNHGALRLRKSDGALIEIHAGDVELDQIHAE
ncbi:Biotin--protein ligase [hydrothermal vent metagenome]|uniref:Biotin--protein ligase n=1 Tax=hydrothermal vent metagenome TaxID=652676 RepID=A0A3B0SM37_9ZZZZ